ncbi:hypothetical protein ACKI1L_38435, partial [Streptomyces scabiei]|uniref:hypothetical protein n=1 Tax=Streptomyces scabiei TaxID=1930 RepID=UPI0038F5E40C
GKLKEGWITKGKEDDEVTVEITIEGDDLKEFLENDSLKKYQSYLINGSKIVLRRSSEITTWIASRSRPKEISIRNVAILNP